MSSDAPKLGTGLFGYRRSAVEQLMAESDARLRDAEVRLRAAETRVSELQRQIDSLKRRHAQVEQRSNLGDGDGDGGADLHTPEPLESRAGWGEPMSRTATKEER